MDREELQKVLNSIARMKTGYTSVNNVFYGLGKRVDGIRASACFGSINYILEYVDDLFYFITIPSYVKIDEILEFVLSKFVGVLKYEIIRTNMTKVLVVKITYNRNISVPNFKGISIILLCILRMLDYYEFRHPDQVYEDPLNYYTKMTYNYEWLGHSYNDVLFTVRSKLGLKHAIDLTRFVAEYFSLIEEMFGSNGYFIDKLDHPVPSFRSSPTSAFKHYLKTMRNK